MSRIQVDQALSYWIAYLVAILSLVILGIIVYTAWSIYKAKKQSPSLELIRRLQSQWRTSLLDDDALANRVVDIITAPIVKEDYRLSLTIEGDYGDDGNTSAIEDEDAIRLAVEISFTLVNVGSQNFVLCFTGAAKDQISVNRKPGATDIIIDGEVVRASEIEGANGGSFEIPMPAHGRSAVIVRSTYSGRLPFFAEFPQNVIVRGGAEVHLISHVYDKIGLQVIGSNEHSFYEDRAKASGILERRLKIDKPLLTGESILLFLGI
jgi:hypothetical protein